MTVKQIIADYLKTHGYDGLCCDDCSCGIEDLMPCDAYGCVSDCGPAYRHEVYGAEKGADEMTQPFRDEDVLWRWKTADALKAQNPYLGEELVVVRTEALLSGVCPYVVKNGVNHPIPGGANYVIAELLRQRNALEAEVVRLKEEGGQTMNEIKRYTLIRYPDGRAEMGEDIVERDSSFVRFSDYARCVADLGKRNHKLAITVARQSSRIAELERQVDGTAVAEAVAAERERCRREEVEPLKLAVQNLWQWTLGEVGNNSVPQEAVDAQVAINTVEEIQRLTPTGTSAISDTRADRLERELAVYRAAFCEAHQPSANDPMPGCPCCEAVHQADMKDRLIQAGQGLVDVATGYRDHLVDEPCECEVGFECLPCSELVATNNALAAYTKAKELL